MKSMRLFCSAGVVPMVALLLAGGVSRAEVTLPSLWADHAVVQRELPVHVWGKASPGEEVTVRFRDETAVTHADKLGQWELNLRPGGPGGPFAVEIEGTNKIHLSDVMVGDVWLASGQSNMEFATKDTMNATEELKDAHQPRIRLFHVERRSSDFPQEDVATKGWMPCTAETVATFSGVAYFFARQIQADQQVPIGLIEADWGGTPAETWTSLGALSSDGALLPAWRTWALVSEDESHAALERGWEQHEREAAVAAGAPVPKFAWHPELRSWLPGGAFNGMIAPLTHFPIRGVLWYQGESNTGPERSYYYERLFSTLIEDWRKRWGGGDFPFLYVQLANFVASPDGQWAEVRDAQRRTLKLNQTAMVVTIDVGDAGNVHPRNKQEVGRRLSLAARAVAYHEPVEFSGPLYRTRMREGRAIRIYFDHAQGGLTGKVDALRGFEIADARGKFVAASGRIDGETVVVSSPEVENPAAVRYGWMDNPPCDLFNRAGLPASPFTTQ